MRAAALAIALALLLPACSPEDSRDRAVAIENVVIKVGEDGTLSWNGDEIDESELDRRLANVARQTPQPQVILVVDKDVSSKAVARIVLHAQRAGVAKASFLTEPGSD